MSPRAWISTLVAGSLVWAAILGLVAVWRMAQRAELPVLARSIAP